MCLIQSTPLFLVADGMPTRLPQKDIKYPPFQFEMERRGILNGYFHIFRLVC